MKNGRTVGSGHATAASAAVTGAGEAPASLATLLDLLGRRFALGVYWSLRGTSLSFRGLAARLEAPEAQLTQRMRELREAGLIEVDEAGDYRLTTHGRRLQGVLEPVADWAEDWARLSPRQRSPRGAATRGHGER